jgi:hypothetical protein
MTENVTAPTNNSSPSLLQKSRLVDQASNGPSLHEAAAQLLRKTLKALCPDQDINPDKAMIASPMGDQDSETQIAYAVRFESLTHALIRLAFSKTTANYIEGEHFLTLTPYASDPVHLAISMDAITQLLNEHAPFLFVILEQSQLDFWNATGKHLPRWQELSDALKAALDVESADGWDADQCTLARLISQQPDKALRKATGTALSNVRAQLLDIDLVEGQTTTHLLLAAALVLTATHQTRELIVMYTIANGYESFSSMAELGASLPARINDVDLSERSLQWRLFEPEGNYFDAAVGALIGVQLDAIDALDPSSRTPLAGKNADVTEHSRPVSARDKTRFELLNKAIPDWLLAGSIDDLQAYSRYITDLGTLSAQTTNDGVDEIPVIQAFAQQQMCDAIIADKEEAATLALNDIRITVTQSFEAGGFTLPDPLHERYETLGEFALQNTPPYLATVAYADDKPAPSWMTVDYLSRISTQVDIGTTYPKLLKRHLIDDPVQALREKRRYHREFPLLLPLLALECKLKQEGDVDERGYRYVCQLIDAIKSAQPSSDYRVDIRPLAFMPKHRLGRTPDIVANMYIIGPRDRSAGPCLLYGPLLDQPLRQFPSLQNLAYALYQPGDLRDSVLAWLPTQALSFEYAQYVFSSGIPSPWTISQLAFEPFIHLDLTGVVELADAPLTGDILSSLFTAHSQAMVELADRQSTSNAERRWSMLADSGWAIFSIAANFLTGAAGTAVWVWQSINQIQQALDAHERGDTIVEWTSIGNVLLALGIILTQRWASQRIHASWPGRKNYRSVLPTDASPALSLPSPALKPTVLQAPDAPTGQLPPSHLTALAAAALPRSTAEARFVHQIDSFKVAAPELPNPPKPLANHLHELNAKLYAQVGERWFQVRVENDIVTIVDPNEPSRVGYEVRYDDNQGRWYWDLKLRLRGGAPPSRIEALRRAKTKQNQDAWVALHRFMGQETAKKNSVTTAMEALSLEETPATAFDETTTGYLAQADELAKGYSQALDDLEQWRETGGAGVFYQAQLMRLTIEQHRYTGAWLRVKMKKYALTTKPLVEHLESGTPMPRDQQIEITGKAIKLSDEMIERLQRLHQSLDRLTETTRDAKKVAADLKKLLPAFTQLDLEANEIGMSNELCVRERPGKNMQEVRQIAVKIFERAANSVHQLIELEDTVRPPEIQAQRIDLLATLVDQLANTEQRLQELSAAWPDHLEAARLDRIKVLIKYFHELARSRLLKWLPEPEETTPVTRPVLGPSTSRPVVKVTKTRPRSGNGGDASTSEHTEKREKAPLIRIPMAHPEQAVALDDNDIVTNALSLNLETAGFITRTRADAQRPGRIPADMKDLFDQQATRLDQAATNVDAVLARRSADFPVGSLGTELREGAARVRRESISVYGAMLMERKPREAYLKWLNEHDQVEIVKDERGRIKTKQRKDYFQEYRIGDKTRQNRPLWVAHFHYDNLTDPDDQFTAAHLKFADGYLQELPAKTRSELSVFDAVDNARRRIVNPMVLDLFLKPEPKPPAGH